mgnify:CR=1 FL=1
MNALISRRTLLKMLALLSLSRFALPTYAQRPRKVIVVGAGVSGLACAQALTNAGIAVTVLEARDRIGGRVWTDNTLGLPLDMGASWIHRTQGNPLTALADQANVARVSTDYDSHTVYDADGRELSDDEQAELDSWLEELLEEARELGETRPTLSLGQAIAQRLSANGVTDEDDLRAIYYALASTIEHEFAASVDDLSAVYWDSSETFDGGDVIFPQGYVWLPNLLASGLSDVRLNTPVRAVRYGRDGVSVTTDGSGTLEADAVVVSVPLGVLKAGKIAFTPALPSRLTTAIQNLHVGLLNKTYLQFERAFWDDSDFIGYMADERGRWSEFLNLQTHLGVPVLLGFNASPYADELETWSDSEIIADALDVLRTIYDDVPDPVGVFITRWGQDVWAHGSYSSLGVNATPADYDAFAQAVEGRLFFAGEATFSAHPATVHGALMSGQRAAQAILRA